MEFENKYWHLVHFQLSKRLTRKEMNFMCTTMEMRHFKRGTELELSQKKLSNDIYFLKRGVIKIVNFTNKGEEVTKYLIKKGDVFGIMGLIDIENNDDYAIVLDDSLVCVIDADYFKKMMDENKNLNNYIFKLIGIRIKKIERNLTSLMYNDAKSRIEDFIKEYIKDFGHDDGDFIVAKNLLSNKEIGKLTSTSRQSVNKTLNELKRNNIIAFDKNMIRINKSSLTNSSVK